MGACEWWSLHVRLSSLWAMGGVWMVHMCACVSGLLVAGGSICMCVYVWMGSGYTWIGGKYACVWVVQVGDGWCVGGRLQWACTCKWVV